MFPLLLALFNWVGAGITCILYALCDGFRGRSFISIEMVIILCSNSSSKVREILLTLSGCLDKFRKSQEINDFNFDPKKVKMHHRNNPVNFFIVAMLRLQTNRDNRPIYGFIYLYPFNISVSL